MVLSVHILCKIKSPDKVNSRKFQRTCSDESDCRICYGCVLNNGFHVIFSV